MSAPCDESLLLADDHADRRAAEVEAARIEIEVGRRTVVLDVAQVPDVTAQTDVIREVPHDAGARVPTEVVVGRAHPCDGAAVHLRPQQTEASRKVRPDAGAVRAADRNAND